MVRESHLNGKKGRLPCHPASAEWMRICSPRGKFVPQEVIHITLQEIFWIVSITWIILQVYDKFEIKKK